MSAIITENQFEELIKRIDINAQSPNFSWENMFDKQPTYAFAQRTKKNQYLRLNDIPKSILTKLPTTFMDESNVNYYKTELLRKFLNSLVHIESDYEIDQKLQNKEIVTYESITRTNLQFVIYEILEKYDINYYDYISQNSQGWLRQAYNLFETNSSYEMRLLCVKDKSTNHFEFTLINSNQDNCLLARYNLYEFTACIGHQNFSFSRRTTVEAQGLFDTFSETSDVIASVKSLLNEDMMNKLASIATNVNDVVEKKDEILLDLKVDIQNALGNVGLEVMKKISLTLSIIGIFISLRDKNYVVAGMSLAILAYAYRNDISEFFSKYASFQKMASLIKRRIEVEKHETQNTRAESGLSSHIPEIASALSLFIVGKDCNSKNIFTGDTLRLFGTAKMAIQSIVNLVLTVIEAIVYSAGYGDKYEKLFMMTQNSDPVYKDFTNKVFDIDNQYREKKLTFTHSNYAMIKETLTEGLKLMRDIPKNASTQGLISTMHSALQRLTTYSKAFMDSGFMLEGLRQEPVAVLLQGGPGTLKTQTMQHLAHALCSAVVDESKRKAFMETPERFIYNRLIENEYWDKYTADKIVCMFDDFLQIRDMAGNGDSEVFNIIRAVNENNYDLHMADIADKGNTSFQCSFIVCTSNSEKLDVQSIHDKGALLRRFKFSYIPVPKDEYKKHANRTHLMKQQVNMESLPSGPLGITSTNPDEVLEFHEMNLFTSKPTGKILQFEEVARKMIAAYEFNKKCYQQKLIELKKQREKYAVQPEMGWFENSSIDDSKIPCAFPDELATEYLTELLNRVSDEKRLFVLTRLEKMNMTNRAIVRKRVSDLLDYNNQFETDISIDESLELLLGNFYVRENLFNFSIPIPTMRAHLVKDEEFASWIHVTCQDLPERTYLESLQDKFNSVTSTLKKKLYDDVHFVDYVSWKNALLTATTLASVVAIFYSFKLYNENSDMKDLISQPEEAEGDYKLKQAKKKVARKNLKSLRQSVVQSQISLVSDKQGEQIIEKVLRHNVFEFTTRKDENSEWVKLGYLTFLKGTIAIMPRHFVDTLVYRLEEEPETIKDAQFRLTSTGNSNDGNREVLLSIYDILSDFQETPVLKDQDLILVNIPDIQPRRDIMKYIMTEKDVDSFGRKPVCVLGKTGKMLSTVQTHGKVMSRVLVNDIDLEPYEIKTTMAYNVATSKGDCGTILGVLSPSMANRKICGIHVAGSPHQNMGYSSIFTLEMIEECLEHFSPEYKISCDPELTTAQFGAPLVGDGRFNAYRDAPIAPSLATKTAEIPSRIQGMLTEPYMKPAKLKAERIDGVIRDPWRYAMTNYRMDVPILNKKVIDEATEDYQDFLFSSSDIDEEKRLYTFEEAVLGIPNTEFDSINRRTSPGYPDVVQKPKSFKGKGKELYFGNDVDFDLDGDYCVILKERVNNTIQLAKQGIRSEHIFMDCLKDELRPIEKADDFKTRLISASSLDLLILYRMYFGAYQLWYKRNRVYNQSAIGVNVYSQEWDMIAKQLQRFSPGDEKNVGAGDYSKFDGTEKPYVHNKILEVINNWYDSNEEDNLIRRVLWLELTNSIHIQGKCIYEWTTSLPSGHPLTPVVNTMYNGIAFRYCWNRAFEHDSMLKRSFNKYCYLIAMGDDNVFSVEGRYAKTFTEVTVGKYMSELGLVYTSETKDVVNTKMRHLSEVEFLKRRWRYCSQAGRFVAPHQVERQLEILNWSKRGARADEICIDNIDSVLRELTLHGSEVYNHWAKKIAIVSQKNLGYYPENMRFSYNYEKILNQEMYC